jgi:hypothetical protein
MFSDECFEAPHVKLLTLLARYHSLNSLGDWLTFHPCRQPFHQILQASAGRGALPASPALKAAAYSGGMLPPLDFHPRD